jgi:hypothetical protein
MWPSFQFRGEYYGQFWEEIENRKRKYWKERNENKVKRRRLFQVDDFCSNTEESEELDSSEDIPCRFVG